MSDPIDSRTTDCNCWQPGLGGDCDGSCQCPEPADFAPQARVQSREERTLRVLYLIARRLYDATNDSQDWYLVQLAEGLINDCAKAELVNG